MKKMMDMARRLWPICRSITGDGVRETLAILREDLPDMKIFEVPTGTQVFDWTVPKEWRIRDAWVEGPDGRRVIDFADSNLHVVGYSTPVDARVSRDELLKHIYVEESAPDAIPYVTSYYKERFGFCMSKNERDALPDGEYHMYIDSELADGSLTYGELIIPGSSGREILFSTYVCHPSMANNELSGPIVTAALAKLIASMPDRRYTYRFVFIPETIGSITYLSRNLDAMKPVTDAGFVISCVGDDRAWSFVASRYGGTLADRTMRCVLGEIHPEYKEYSFLARGSDERQYCAPGVDLPVVAFCRSKYGEYPEYHTSLDDLSLISEEAMRDSLDALKTCVDVLEANRTYRTTCKCEPQLGRRGLYPTTSKKGCYGDVRTTTDFIAYADGTNDLIEIARITGRPISALIPIAKVLSEGGVVDEVRQGG